jgi:hypothetical protein
MMFNVLVDTCVWLDVAKDPKQHPVVGVVEQMVHEKMISLLVPRLVVDEFRRNRQRIEKESIRSLSTHFKLVREAVDKAGGNKRRMKVVLAHLDEVNHQIPLVGGAAVQALDRIDKLLTAAPPIEASEPIMLRAAQRAVDRRAPFHRDRNSMADAILIETYAECIAAEAARGARFAFVTHNKADFSPEEGSHKDPHPDLMPMFAPIKSLYFINLVEALRKVDPSFVTDTMFEYSFDQEPRGLHDILEAEELLFHQVWYNRHKNLAWRIRNGEHRIVTQEEWERSKDYQNTTIDSVWDGALAAARKTEERLGKGNTGPWDDFEWGMINGKLSALRWVLGDEWDMLDT